MQVDLHDQIALILGGDERLASALADGLKASGGRVLASKGLSAEAGDAAATEAIGRFGRLDMLIAIPGTLTIQAEKGSGLPLPDRGDAAEFRPLACIESALRVAEAALSNTNGRVLVLSSALGVVGARAAPRRSAMDACLLATVRSLAMRLGPAGIRVNALSLGVIAATSPPGEELVSGSAGQLSHVPTGRAGTLADVVEAALFLLDPQNSYMTGHALVLDGGWSAGYARDF
jgi:NAD(P)-dependent dehydrogenase (short-subunit alcohol dehydrogenase family)